MLNLSAGEEVLLPSLNLGTGDLVRGDRVLFLYGC